MTGSSSSYMSTSSTGIFTGSFGAVEYAEAVLQRYDEVLMQALKAAAQDEQARVRKAALQMQSGWSELSDKLLVQYDHEGRQFTYTIEGDERTQEKGMNLEYGNGHLAPEPLLRSNAIQSDYTMGASINEVLRSGLMEGF